MSVGVSTSNNESKVAVKLYSDGVKFNPAQTTATKIFSIHVPLIQLISYDNCCMNLPKFHSTGTYVRIIIMSIWLPSSPNDCFLFQWTTLLKRGCISILVVCRLKICLRTSRTICYTDPCLLLMVWRKSIILCQTSHLMCIWGLCFYSFTLLHDLVECRDV